MTPPIPSEHRADRCTCGHIREQHKEEEHKCLFKVTQESNGQTVIRKKCPCEAFVLAPAVVKTYERLTNDEFKEQLELFAARLGGAFGAIHGSLVAIVQENRDLILRIEALEDKLKK